MKVSRGAQRAISSFESTGMSPGVLAAERRFGGAVLHEVAGHPVVLAAGEALHGLAEVAAQQRGSAFAGRADQHHGEALIEGHGDERGLAVARDAFDADMLRVDGGIGLEIIEAAARAPGPGAQRAPVFRLARLAFVDQADDAAREAGAVVGLHAGGIEAARSPSRRRPAARCWADRHLHSAAEAGRTALP